jgi:toxin FitB
VNDAAGLPLLAVYRAFAGYAYGAFCSAMTLGEIEAGIEKQRNQNTVFADALAQWLATTEQQFAHCVLPVTPAIAKLWGRLCVQTGNKGIDNLIAATALCHNLTLVTRHVKHFEPTGVRVVNPSA